MKWILTALVGIQAYFVSSQGLITTSDYMRDYARLLEIQGKDINYPILHGSNQLEIWTHDDLPKDSLGLWKDQLKYYSDNRENKGANLYLLSPRVDYVYSSRYSRSYNDGPLWSGRGHSIGLNAGVKGHWGPLSAVFYPNFFHAQNKYFQRQSPRGAGIGELQNIFNYQLSNQIDWVQFYGYEPRNDFDFGQSYIAANFGHLMIKFGTENIWWGPSVINPIIFSNTAPGFPNLTIGTHRPVRTKYGDFELNTFWGQLRESDFFSNLSQGSKRYMVGLAFGYRPSFLEFMKGLSIGLGRTLQKFWPADGLSGRDIFLVLKNTDPSPTGFVNDDNDQYITLDVRWFFQQSDAEIYLEWARNDFWLNFQDLVSEPEPGNVFTIGMQKSFKTDRATWRFGFENTSLAATRTVAIRNSGDIYTHSVVTHGHTNLGSLLGAPIGPGSKSQLLRLDRFDEKGKYGFSLNRIRFNDNHYWRRFSNNGNGDFQRHDVEWNFNFEAVRFFKNYEFSGRFIYSRRMNWHYFGMLDVNNYQFLTSVKYHITNKPLLTLFAK